MSHTQQAQTAAIDRIPLAHKVAYGCGAFANNTLAAAIGGMMMVLNLGLGLSVASVAALGALPRLVDALSDPLMGYLSDKTRTRYGRRRPYIFFGAIAAGVTFALLWQFPADQSAEFYYTWFLVGSVIFYMAYTVFATPWVALGYELTPDYHERTRLMGVQNFIGSTAYMVAPYFLAIMYLPVFGDVVTGSRYLGLIIGVVVVVLGVIPAITLRERFQEVQEGTGKSFAEFIADFFKGLFITIKFPPFLKLCIATFMVFNGFILISSFQPYVILFYVFAGDEEAGSVLVGHAGLVQAIISLFVIMFITWLSTKIGKRRAFFISTSIAMVGYALKWFCYTPENPWLVLLPAPFMAFGLAGLFTLMTSMMADVADADELNTHERREGMYGSIFWWVVKLGMSAAILGGGLLLAATGFDEQAGGAQPLETITMMRFFDAFVPVVTSAIAIWAVYSYDLTEEKAQEIRTELEARRGVV